MPVTDPIDTTINAAIKPNGVGAITATVLATTLTAITAWVALYFAPIASPTFTGTVSAPASSGANSGFNLGVGTAPVSPINGDMWNTSSGVYLYTGGTIVGPVGAPTAAGGASGQVQFNSAGTFGGFTVGGDATLNTSTGALTISKTGGVAFGALATASTVNLSSQASGTLQAAQAPALYGAVNSVAGSLATTLATVNSNVGSFGSGTAVPNITINAEGLVTSAGSAPVTPPVSSITGLGSGVAAALGNAANAASAFPTVNGSPVIGDTLKWSSAGVQDSGTVGCGYPGIVCLADYGASGSVATTTGSMTSGSNTLTVTAALDFANLQRVRVKGAGSTYAVAQPSGLTVTPTGTTGSTTYTYTIASTDGNGGVGKSITNVTTTTGNATLSGSNYNALSWTSPGGWNAIYGRSAGSLTLLALVNGTSWNDNGAAAQASPPDWLPTAPLTVAAQNDWLISRINSGGGTTTLTLNQSASNTVSGVVVDHDDTSAIQAAINALPATGGTVVGCGNYNITSPLNIGNGSGGTTNSTQNGVILQGCGAGNRLTGVTGSPTTSSFNINYLGEWQAIAVNGPISSFGFQNLSLFASAPSTSMAGISVICGNYGVSFGLQVTGFPYGINETTTSSCAGSYNDWRMSEVYMPPYLYNAVGARIYGTSTTDHYDDVWSNIIVIPTTVGQTCLYLGPSDSNKFISFTCNPIVVGNSSYRATGVMLDYTQNSGWPSATFYSVDLTENTVFEIGTPVNNGPNVAMYDFSVGNGAPLPTYANIGITLQGLAPPYYTIGGLPTCNATGAGNQAYVTNGVASPTYASTPSTTGTTKDHVWCNGSAWVYGMLDAPGNDNFDRKAA